MVHDETDVRIRALYEIDAEREESVSYAISVLGLEGLLSGKEIEDIRARRKDWAENNYVAKVPCKICEKIKRIIRI